MLILVYLVFMLSQTDNVSSSENSGVYPIESSQKLMLTIPTELPCESVSDFDGLYSTTESLAAITDNLISKSDNIFIGTHPLFPIQEPMTTPMTIIDEIKLENEILSEENFDTTTLPESITEDELSIPTSTEEIISEDIINQTNNDHETTSTESIVISIPTVPQYAPPPPIKRSLSLDGPQVLTTIDATTKPQMRTTTPTISLAESTEKDQHSTNLSLMTNTPASTIAPILSTPPTVSDDSLFQDNWSNQLPVEDEGYNIDSNDGNLDFMREPAKSLFQNEDSEITPTELSPLENELSDSSSLVEQNQEISSDIENTSHLSYSDTEDTQPMFSPQNLLNLFTFDHQPSSSNLKQTTWWPKSKSSSLSFLAENAAKNQKQRANRILRHDDSQEITRNQRAFNSLLNRKLKSSANILQKLFGNYFLQ